ncbi:M48 family metallopeptidase [Alicyclobacillus suci]|uniref:M48 family metallopeptidase n=1 Tax=Alicyclobacillus suci TaxID=2816080 RepID=UPI0011BDA865|nr:SprT family zinc-dependent metalloprotease [Alicyclobacillus suci]
MSYRDVAQDMRKKASGLTYITLSDGTSIHYQRTPARARQVRVILRVVDGVLQVSAPKHISQRVIEQVIDRHQNWILDMLNTATKRIMRPIQAGDTIWLYGQNCILKAHHTNQVIEWAVASRQILIPDTLQNGQLHNAVYTWLRILAKTRLRALAQDLAREFHCLPKQIVIKEQKRRWGSCSSKGNINLNWRLIQAPQAVQSYVIIHELAHLTEMNHGPRFWALVRAMMPNYDQHRKWLTIHGERLYDIQPEGILIRQE